MHYRRGDPAVKGGGIPRCRVGSGWDPPVGGVPPMHCTGGSMLKTMPEYR